MGVILSPLTWGPTIFIRDGRLSAGMRRREVDVLSCWSWGYLSGTKIMRVNLMDKVFLIKISLFYDFSCNIGQNVRIAKSEVAPNSFSVEINRRSASDFILNQQFLYPLLTRKFKHWWMPIPKYNYESIRQATYVIKFYEYRFNFIMKDCCM